MVPAPRMTLHRLGSPGRHGRRPEEIPQLQSNWIDMDVAGRDESVLDVLVRNGIVISAPCGGRGICGKCRVTLIEGSVSLVSSFDAGGDKGSGTVKSVQSGESFPACRGRFSEDIIVGLSSETVVTETDPHIQRSPGSMRKVRRAGIGIDIGTTTIQAELVDLDSGESLETVSALNDQRSFGADVMSRINAARQGKTGELFSLINRQLANLMKELLQHQDLSTAVQCNVSGNTTMLHLFAHTDPSAMGEIPFTPVFLEERHFTGKELSLPVETITLLPGISAFVGADIVSGLAVLDMLNREEGSLLVDIGTNGEMALLKKGRLYCCSTAAGPCFEGAEISCGMGALPGAINRVRIRGKTDGPASLQSTEGFSFGPLWYTTVGDIPPRGICGAGLIDVLAAMKQLDVIDETGALADDYVQTGFPLAENICLAGKDVRQFQLAKSAVRTGIDLLRTRAGLVKTDPVQQIPEAVPASPAAVYIAGGLGFFLDRDNAVTLGLLPPEFSGQDSVHVCGNVSLKGAVQSLIDKDFLSNCLTIVSRCETVDLAQDSEFGNLFAENMFFYGTTGNF